MAKKKTRKQAWTEPRLPAERIAELALGIFTGQIFTSGMVREHDAYLLPALFLGITALSKKEARGLREHSPEFLWGDMNHTCPRSINGYPVFLNWGMIYAQDAERIREKYRALQVAAKEILKP